MRVIVVVAGLLCIVGVVRALETDQFTAPPAPLVDLGEQFQEQVRGAILAAVGDAEEKRGEHLRGAEEALFKFIREDQLKKAELCLGETAIARAVFGRTVRSGHPQCKMELWARSTDFDRQPARFEPRLDKTVFGALSRPITIQHMSPTINLYGQYVGTDKIGHFFEQGYEYYVVYMAEMGRTGDQAAAVRKAVKKGVGQENGIYGMFIDSVYSNADLAANYAGLKFFINLTRPVVIDGRQVPPILVLRDQRWQLNPAGSGDFMRDYVTEHWNEALNPSKYGWPLRDAVRKNLRGRLDTWLAFYNTTPEAERQRLVRLRTWHGEEYGHCGFEQLVTIPGVAERALRPQNGRGG